jgi:nucleoside-diphosphate-sugar epimerase
MSRVLVTGGSGFVGRHCVASLARAGHEVHAVRFRSAAPEVGDGVHWHEADLLRADEVGELLSRVAPTGLLHAAWNVEPGVYWTSPRNLAWVGASLELVKSFVECGGRRAVVVGSCAEYDWSFGYCHETQTPIRPDSLYGTCKNALREMLAAYAAEAGLSLAWARLFFLYGPHEHPARLIPTVIESLLAGRPVDCTDGTQVRDFLHVADAGEALVQLLLGPVEGPVNIGSGHGSTVREVVSRVAEQLGGLELVRFGAKRSSADEPPLLVADVARLQDEVGFVPDLDLESGLTRTIDWWRGRK